MNKRKSHIILIISTLIFLILLFFIQIKQLIETAETEKRHFAQSVKLSLNLVATEMSRDRKMCKNVQSCLLDTQSFQNQELKKLEWHKVDSIIKFNLEQYNIDLDYEFEIFKAGSGLLNGIEDTCEACYSESLEIALQQSGMELMVRFPEKNMFIVKRIGGLFISSITLIILVTFSFILTLSLFLKEKMLAERIKNFINNMVHEFKTPLASIGFANHRIQSNKEYVLPEKLIKYTEIIENEKNQLQHHVSNILELAQMESEFKPVRFGIVNIKSAIEEAIQGIDWCINEKNGSIDFLLHTDETNVNGSKFHLINAFSNLLDNACKYSLGELKIKICLSKIKDQLLIEIIDNGIGISAKHQKFIFEKFYRVPTGNIHNIKGYGIGLSYVLEVVKMHKGKIELKSSEGNGSTFSIYLPLN
jgi:two-component system phosphate regulon sensor histidine kinase PhoR